MSLYFGIDTEGIIPIVFIYGLTIIQTLPLGGEFLPGSIKVLGKNHSSQLDLPAWLLFADWHYRKEELRSPSDGHQPDRLHCQFVVSDKGLGDGS